MNGKSASRALRLAKAPVELSKTAQQLDRQSQWS